MLLSSWISTGADLSVKQIALGCLSILFRNMSTDNSDKHARTLLIWCGVSTEFSSHFETRERRVLVLSEPYMMSLYQMASIDFDDRRYERASRVRHARATKYSHAVDPEKLSQKVLFLPQLVVVRRDSKSQASSRVWQDLQLRTLLPFTRRWAHVSNLLTAVTST